MNLASKSCLRKLSVVLVIGLIFTSMFSLFSLANRSKGSQENPDSKGIGGDRAKWIPMPAGLPSSGDYNGIASGDVNNDGKLDFAVARADLTMHVYVNDGSGNFPENSSGLPGFGNAYDVVLADFNNDGNLDLAGDGLYLGDGGAGGSMTWTYNSNPINWYAVTASDVNLDGKMDLVVGTASSGVHAWTGDGGGGGSIAWTDSSVGLPSSGTYFGVAVGDINHDGKPDIVCASNDDLGIKAYLGNGQTGLSSLWTEVSTGSGLPNTGSYMGIEMADLNHDGNLDIVSSAFYDSYGVRVWLGNGGVGGTMSWTESSSGLETTRNSYIDVSLNDVDNDGNVDIFAARFSTGLKLWYGDGGAGGTLDWTENSTGLPSGDYVGVSSGDFNLDGKVDFVVSIYGGIEIWLNERPDFIINGYSPISQNLPTAGTWYDIVFGDVNNDGDLDLAVSSANNRGVRVFTGNSTTGSWTNASSGLPTSGTYNGLRFADVDHNGTLDLVGGMNGGGGSAVKVWYRNSTTGSWTETSVSSPFPVGGGLEVFDVNHDGNEDIVTCDWGASRYVYVFLGDGAGNWDPNTGPSETNGYDDVAVGDVNHDGDLDIISTTMTNGIETRLWLGDGSGSVWNLQTPGIPTSQVYLGAALADANHDGDLDAAIAGFGSGNGIHFWTGDGGAGGPVVWNEESAGLPTINDFSGVEFGDLDIDGNLDLVYAGRTNGIGAMTGDGGSGGSITWTDASKPALPTTGAYWGVALGDVNNDGKLEIGVTKDGGVEVWKLDIGTVVNQPPRLVGGQVLPPSGNVNDQFTYNVTYRDQDNQAPVPAPFVRINKGGVPYGASPYQMTPQNWVGLPGNYTAGRNYIYTISLTDCGDDFTFVFNASDGISETNTGSSMGPTVNCGPEARAPGVQGFLDGSSGIGHVTDHTPSLNWTFYDSDPGDSQVRYNATVWDGSISALLWFNNVSSPSDNDFYNSTWTATEDLVDGADYWFRINVYDGSAWSGWTGVMFHMNAPPPTAVPPLSPADDGVVPSSSGQVLSWTSGGADAEDDTITYYWYVDIDSPPMPPYNASGFTTGLSSNPFVTGTSTDYYWYVNATDGWEWNWTVIWNFTTSSAVNAPPEALSLTVQGFPDGTPGILHVTDNTPDLGWSFSDPDPGDAQQQYVVRVGSTPGSSNIWAPGPQPGPAALVTYSGPPLADGTDYWFGVAVFDGNTWSPWNETMFHMNGVGAAGLTVQGFAPGTAGISNITDHTPDLGWTFFDTEPGDFQQEYEIRVGTAFGASDMWATGPLGGTAGVETYAGLELLDGIDYWFGIRVNDSYEWSAWNDTKFHMNMPPTPPTIPSPLNGAAGLPPGSQVISWNAVTDQEGSSITYYWYVSTDASFASILDSGMTSTTSDTFNTLQATTYYWRVQAHDGYEYGSNSTTWNFITNRPPTLDWTGESGFVNDGVNPDQGNTSTSFEFRISYSDEDNQTGTIKLVILEGSTEVLNSTMDEVDSGDVTYFNGKLYNLSEELSAGTYSYHFYGVDTVGASTKTSDIQLIVSEVRGTIRGKITDESGTPLENAEVKLLKDGQVVDSALTNNLGEFEFSDLELGNYSIEISKGGYHGKTATANLNQTLLELEPIKLNKIEEFPWWLILVLLIIVVVVILLLLLFLKRRKKKDEIEESNGMTQSSNEIMEPQ